MEVSHLGFTLRKVEVSKLGDPLIYSASLFQGNKRLATVKDNGKSFQVEFVHRDRSWIQDDATIQDIVTVLIEAHRMVEACKYKTYFITTESLQGEMEEVNRPYTSRLAQYLRNKYNVVYIYNEHLMNMEDLMNVLAHIPENQQEEVLDAV